jgi:hypothetical protein
VSVNACEVREIEIVAYSHGVMFKKDAQTNTLTHPIFMHACSRKSVESAWQENKKLNQLLT